MRFEYPELLNGLWTILPLAAFLWWGQRQKQRMLHRLAAAHLLAQIVPTYSSRKTWLASVAIILVFFFSILALARPQWGFEIQEIKRRGLDIILVIDTSRSMLTRDVAPNRLERTKLAVKELLTKLRGDRVGIVAFAGSAFMVCPLTVDYGIVQQGLEELDTDVIARGGTNLEEAMKVAMQDYDNTPSRYKAMIILTDGEGHEGQPLNAAKAAKQKGIKIYSVGIGTREGELINVTDEKGEASYLKDAQGNTIKSRLNESLLQDIALNTGGIYVRAAGAQLGLDLIYEKDLAHWEARELANQSHKRYHERFQIPLGLALACLLVSIVAGTELRKHPIIKKGTVVIFGALSMLMVGNREVFAFKSGDIKDGNKAYEQGDYAASIEKYEKALTGNEDSDIINFNLGTTYYQQGAYERAVQHFFKALLTDDPALRARVHYNLGNTLYKQGIAGVETDKQKAVESLEQALSQYQSSLKINPDDEDAKHNYDYVSNVLEQLKKEMEKEKKQAANSKKQDTGEQQEDASDQRQDSSDKQPKDGNERQQDFSGQQQEDSSEKQPASHGKQPEDSKQKQSALSGKQPDEGDGRQHYSGDQQKSQQGNSLQTQTQGNGKGQKEATQQEDAQEMTPREAQMYLGQFGEEEHQLFMPFRHEGAWEQPVEKDW
jgi:Ca-activated chloride channel family protein